MISYKLAKELKENGFPQKGKGSWWNWVVSSTNGIRDWHLSPGHWDDKYKDAIYYYVPTLSELIEEVNKIARFACLELSGDNDWRAYAVGGIESGFCKAPDIAVAKLYLALNK